MLIGIDEVGRGAWAGPMVIGGAVFNASVVTFGRQDGKVPHWLVAEKIKIADSKCLTSQERELADGWIRDMATIAVVDVPVEMIRDQGLRKAWEWGVQLVIEKLHNELVTGVVIDGLWGVPVPEFLTLECKARADQTVFEVACASIVAKVYRDALMKELNTVYQGAYGWHENKGYGTAKHQQALLEHGPCEAHRTAWVSNWIRKSEMK